MMDAMETKERKTGLKAVYRLCPVAHTVALVSAVMILLHLALRGNQPLMARIGSGFLHPMHEKLALLCDKLGRHSAAEALILKYAKDTGCVLILVTHSLQQARRVADEALFFHKGRLLESGEAPQLLCRPAQPETRQFLEFYGN